MKRGAQPGNKNAVGKGQFKEALKRAMARKSGNVTDGLVKVAEKLLESVDNGEAWAIQEVANRFDGKPTVIVGGDEDNPVVTRIERVIIRPEN